MFLRYLKELFSGKYQIIWIPSFQSINVDLGKDIAHNNVFCPWLKNGNVLRIMGKHVKAFGLRLTDLSEAFDCFSHESLLTKLHAYGFSFSALRLIHSYLTYRKQRTKVSSSYSSWEEMLFGVPQGSILGPLLCNIFLCDIFFVMNDIDFASYADNNTPYVPSDNIEDVIRILENDSIKLLK